MSRIIEIERDHFIACANPAPGSGLVACPYCDGAGSIPDGFDEPWRDCDECDGRGTMPAISTRCRVEVFRFGGFVTAHARAERCDVFRSHRQRDDYAVAKTRGLSLSILFDRWSSAELAAVTWAEIAAAVRHCAGARP